jgi:hypothetical protein
VLAATYRTALPAEDRLIEEMTRTRRMLEMRTDRTEGGVGPG